MKQKEKIAPKCTHQYLAYVVTTLEITLTNLLVGLKNLDAVTELIELRMLKSIKMKLLQFITTVGLLESCEGLDLI